MAALTFDLRTDESERAKFFGKHMSMLHPAQEKLIELTRDAPDGDMLGSCDSILLLCNMIKFAGAKKCIDIGVLTGYSALSWALSIPEDGKVVACDITDEYAKVGIPIWEEAGVYDKIDFRVGDAVETLQSMIDDGEAGTYDFVFIDADKENYDSYYELSLKLLRKDGIIAVDNTWFYGRVIHQSTERGRIISNLCDKIRMDPRVTAVNVDIGDGEYIVRKN